MKKLTYREATRLSLAAKQHGWRCSNTNPTAWTLKQHGLITTQLIPGHVINILCRITDAGRAALSKGSPKA